MQAMVRPRTGDFLYSSSELEVMIEDIQSFKALCVTGVVFGVLTCGGRIHVDHTKLFGPLTSMFYSILTRLVGSYRKLYRWKVPLFVISLYGLLISVSSSSLFPSSHRYDH